jgi:uncharacterized RDD family membrane protein YckC
MNAIAPAQASFVTGPSLDNKRVAAALIDLGVLFLFGFLLGILGGARTPGIDFVILGWALYYYFALEMMTGQTLGKRAMGLKVVRSDGSPADMRAIGIRTVLRVIDGFAFYLVGLVVMIATKERRQRLGDLAADTVVTTADAAPPEVQPAEAAAPPPAPSPDFSAPEAPVAPSFEPITRPAVEPPSPPRPGPPPSPPEEGPPGEPIVGAPERTAEHPPEPAEGPPPEIKIVSPIDLVMADGEESQNGPPAPPPGDQAA